MLNKTIIKIKWHRISEVGMCKYPKNKRKVLLIIGDEIVTGTSSKHECDGFAYTSNAKGVIKAWAYFPKDLDDLFKEKEVFEVNSIDDIHF